MSALTFLAVTPVHATTAAPTKGPSTVSSSPDAAIVNGEKISRDEILEAIAELKKRAPAGQTFPEDQMFAFLREQYIRIALLKEMASKSGIESDSEYIQRLKEFKEGLLLRTFLAKKQKEWLDSITPDMLKTEMEKLKATEHVLKLQQMIVADQKTAERIKKALESGKSFKTLAQTHALNKNKKVDLDPIPEMAIPAEERKTFSALKPGEVLVIPGEGGCTIIKLLAREKISDVKMLERFAREKIVEQLSNKFLASLFDKSKIQRFDLNGNTASAPAGEAPDATPAAAPAAPAPSGAVPPAAPAK